MPSARNAVPAGTPDADVGGASQPWSRSATTSTASPFAIPSRSASSGESSTCWRAIVNWSAGEISTSGAAQIER